jgi:hypothetical protein
MALNLILKGRQTAFLLLSLKHMSPKNMENLTTQKWSKRIVFSSFVLLFFTIPHTLEDFATGAPQEANIPASTLSTFISMIFFLQMLGVYLLALKKKHGVYIHIFLGLFWPVASGIAQLPAIFTVENYRDGFVSKLYVFGMIVIGLFMLFAAIMTLKSSKNERVN